MARPRGILARALYDKYHNDAYIENYDMKLWYKLPNDGKEIIDRYRSKFFNLTEPDPITLHWISQSKSKSADLWLQLWHIICKAILKLFLTQTCCNGLLKRGSMFIMSEVQFANFLHSGGFQFGSDSHINYLDVGAGDGEITLRLAQALTHLNSNISLNVYASESSYIMKDRLREKNFTVINDIRSLENVHLISALNVLDRCSDPKTLLNDIHQSLHPNGRALLALVLPYNHFVERSSSHLPVEALLPHWPTKSLPFNEEINIFFQTLESMGFRIESFTKSAYLCEGDLRQSFYWLIDILVIVSKV
ncbi:protein-L-histidine N-pros-methyltransferase [Chironomus tepperi]|uniref:protein-L-histidine N-pros-methyltransferase n=1 Tax=Chironomus tepperi TaxID=113505 RepID=UPI00391FC72E